jgi:hypothetical protein|tara:strand:- start:188 stop:532 length:345 start_codon:yes stop_codon:yes gene_type:complete
MRIKILILLSLILLVSQHAFSHSDHAAITKDQAVSIASNLATQFSEKDAGLSFGKLPISWASIPSKNISIYKNGKGYYIVSVENDSEQKTLYVLMSSSGEVYDANFSGIFKGVE